MGKKFIPESVLLLSWNWSKTGLVFFQITQEKNNDAIDEEDDDMDYDDPETGDFPKF